MKSPSACLTILALALLSNLLVVPSAKAQFDDAAPIQTAGMPPALLRDVGLDQKLGNSIPLDLTFRDEHGHTVALRQFFRAGRIFLAGPDGLSYFGGRLDPLLDQSARSLSSPVTD